MTSNEQPISLIPLGVGDAFSSRHYGSCFVVEADGARLLIDSPHPMRKMLREGLGQGFDLDAIDAIVLTHAHSDHAGGLELVGYYASHLLNHRLPLLALDDVHEALHLDLDPDCFERRLLDLGKPVEVGPFVISCQLTRHPVPTAALRVQVGHDSVGFSADTPFDEDLLSWLEPCDFIAHEVGPAPMHTAYEDLLDLPAALRTRLHLTHMPDTFNEKDSKIDTLEQGRRYRIGR